MQVIYGCANHFEDAKWAGRPGFIRLQEGFSRPRCLVLFLTIPAQMRYTMLLNKKTWRMRNLEFHLACSAPMMLRLGTSEAAIFIADCIHHLASRARTLIGNSVGVPNKLKL